MCPRCGRSPCACVEVTVAPTGSGSGRSPGAMPETIGRYRITAELGRGGMGVVYRAEDPELQRTVAIKLILDVAGAGPELLQRFVQEARAAAKLQHPGIVALHEVGNHDGQPFLVMDYVEGETFEAALRRERQSPRRVATVVRELALALEHAHSRGILHRDVKPQNVLLDAEGRAHLMDFGLARDASAEEQLTRTGQVLGTLQYMAPEQAGGEQGEQGPRTDVYALGGILYRALTDQPVFASSGGQFGLIKQVLFDDPKPLRQVVPNAHPDLETIALRCLEKEPARRYPSAAEVAEELRRFLDGEAIAARPLNRRERLARWSRRNKALGVTFVVSAVLVLGLLGAGVAGGIYSVQRIRVERDEAKRARDEAQGARVEAESARDEAKRDRDEADRQRANARTQLTHALREKGTRLARESRHQEAWAFLAKALENHDSLATRWALGQARARAPRPLRIFQTKQSVAQTTSTNRQVAVVLQGQGSVLTLGDDGVAEQWNAVTGDALQTQSLGGELVWARGGLDWLMSCTQKNRVTVWDLRRGDGGLRLRERVSFDAELEDGERVSSLAASREHAAVAVGGRVQVWDLRRGESGRVHATRRPAFEKPHTNAVRDLAFAPGGRVLASSALDKTVKLWDLERGEAHTLRGHSNGVNGLAFATDGSFLASAAGDGTIRLWGLRGGARRPADPPPIVLTGHDGGVDPLVLSEPIEHPAAGQRSWLLASGSMDKTIRLWRVTRTLSKAKGATTRAAPVELQVESLACLIGHERSIVALDMRGDALVSRGVGGELRTWDLRPLQAQPVLRGHREDLSAVAFDAGGRRLATSAWNRNGHDPRILLWGVPDGNLECVLEGHTAGVFALAFHPTNSDLVASGSQDGSVRLWSAGEQRQVALVDQKPPGRQLIRALVFSPDGKRLLWSRGSELLAYDLEAQALVALEIERPAKAYGSLAFGPGGHLLAAGDFSHEVRVYDLRAGTMRWRQPYAKHPIVAVAFSPDGKTVASGGQVWEIDVHRWDAETGVPLKALSGHRGGINALAYHPRLPILASASADGRVKLWLRSDGSEVATLRGHTGGVRSVAFSPDGGMMATASKDGTARLWDLEALTLPAQRLVDEAPSATWLRIERIDRVLRGPQRSQ